MGVPGAKSNGVRGRICVSLGVLDLKKFENLWLKWLLSKQAWLCPDSQRGQSCLESRSFQPFCVPLETIRKVEIDEKYTQGSSSVIVFVPEKKSDFVLLALWQEKVKNWRLICQASGAVIGSTGFLWQALSELRERVCVWICVRCVNVCFWFKVLMCPCLFSALWVYTFLY